MWSFGQHLKVGKQQDKIVWSLWGWSDLCVTVGKVCPVSLSVCVIYFFFSLSRLQPNIRSDLEFNGADETRLIDLTLKKVAVEDARRIGKFDPYIRTGEDLLKCINRGDDLAVEYSDKEVPRDKIPYKRRKNIQLGGAGLSVTFKHPFW